MDGLMCAAASSTHQEEGCRSMFIRAITHRHHLLHVKMAKESMFTLNLREVSHIIVVESITR
jgi:hypothetical protein